MRVMGASHKEARMQQHRFPENTISCNWMYSKICFFRGICLKNKLLFTMSVHHNDHNHHNQATSAWLSHFYTYSLELHSSLWLTLMVLNRNLWLLAVAKTERWAAEASLVHFILLDHACWLASSPSWDTSLGLTSSKLCWPRCGSVTGSLASCSWCHRIGTEPHCYSCVLA